MEFFKKLRINRGFLILLGIVMPFCGFFLYGFSLPEIYESNIKATITPAAPPLDPWSLLTHPEHWTAMFPFIEKTEQLGLNYGPYPTYLIKEKNHISYILQLHEMPATQTVRWDIVKNPNTADSYVEAILRPSNGKMEISIQERVHIRSSWMRAYYQILKGYNTNHQAFGKVLQENNP